MGVQGPSDRFRQCGTRGLGNQGPVCSALVFVLPVMGVGRAASFRNNFWAPNNVLGPGDSAVNETDTVLVFLGHC